MEFQFDRIGQRIGEGARRDQIDLDLTSRWSAGEQEPRIVIIEGGGHRHELQLFRLRIDLFGERPTCVDL